MKTMKTTITKTTSSIHTVLTTALLSALLLFAAACGGVEPWEASAWDETSTEQPLIKAPPTDPACLPVPTSTPSLLADFPDHFGVDDDDQVGLGDGDAPGAFGTVHVTLSEEGFEPFRHDRKVLLSRGGVALQEAFVGAANRVYTRYYRCPCGVVTEPAASDNYGKTQRARCVLQ